MAFWNLRAHRFPIFALALWSAVAGCSTEPAADRQNLVVIVIDTLRPDRLGSFGHETARTPNLDAFCAESFVFEKAQSVAPWTAPALISLVTGLYPEVHHVRGFSEPPRLADGVVTLAQILSDEGYATGGFTEGGYAKGIFGLNRGFQVFPANPGDESSHTSNMKFGSRLEANLDRAVDWLDANAAKDFFLLFHSYEPHSPYHPRPEFAGRHRPGFDHEIFIADVQAVVSSWNSERRLDREGAVRIGQASYYDGFASVPKREDGSMLEDRMGFAARSAKLGVDVRRYGEVPEIAEFASQFYDAEVEYVDGELQRLLSRLEELGVAQETVVVIVSDHGEGLGEHGLIEHGQNLHEELLNIVCVVRAPMLDSTPRRIADVVRLVDVHPTVLDLLGVEGNPDDVQGRSLVPLMQGEVLEAEVAFSHSLSVAPMDDTFYSVRDERFRLIFDTKSKTGRLFDLHADPDELHDISSDQPEVQQRLLGELRAWRSAGSELTRRLQSDRVQSVVIDAATSKELGELGYTGPGRSGGK